MENSLLHRPPGRDWPAGLWSHAAIKKEGGIVLAEPRGKGMPGAIRNPYEIRKEADYFGDIPDEKIPKQMLDLAVRVVEGWA